MIIIIRIIIVFKTNKNNNCILVVTQNQCILALACTPCILGVALQWCFVTWFWLDDTR